jgi:threonyl-tRNA synthetase
MRTRSSYQLRWHLVAMSMPLCRRKRMDGRSGRRPVRDEQVFNKGLRSWHGLMRTHAFEQDDANVFCREEDGSMTRPANVGLPIPLNPARPPYTEPKFEFALRDPLSAFVAVRHIGLDCVLPERLGASYGP